MGKRQLFILSGVSGSGKTTALDALEDLGFTAVENLPEALLPAFIDYLIGKRLVGKGPDFEIAQEEQSMRRGREGRFALLLDFQDDKAFKTLSSETDRASQNGYEVRLLFLDCEDEVVMRRFRETRRPHPLLVSDSADTVKEALAHEREILAPFRASAERIIDTSSMTPHELRRAIEDYAGSRERSLNLSLLSFGFKYGVPHDADLVADVRFLPNPHFVPELRAHSGKEQNVADYVFRCGDAEQFTEQYLNLLLFLLPRYLKEGKRYVTVAIGCTGGRHRSVAITERLSLGLKKHDFESSVTHRDLSRNA